MECQVTLTVSCVNINLHNSPSTTRDDHARDQRNPGRASADRGEAGLFEKLLQRSRASRTTATHRMQVDAEIGTDGIIAVRIGHRLADHERAAGRQRVAYVGEQLEHRVIIVIVHDADE